MTDARRIHFEIRVSNGCPDDPVYRTVVVDGYVERTGRIILLDVWGSPRAYRAQDCGEIMASAPMGSQLDDGVRAIVSTLNSFPSLLRDRRHYVAIQIRRAAERAGVKRAA